LRSDFCPIFVWYNNGKRLYPTHATLDFTGIFGFSLIIPYGDLLKLTWDDVYDFERDNVRSSITLIEQKTGKSKSIALNVKVVNALKLFAHNAAKQGRFLIENSTTQKAISRIQAYRLIVAASKALEFQHRVSCHSLRKTFGYHAWKDGVSPAILMEIYNHSSLAVTRLYLGISQDDIDAVYLNIKLIA